MSRRWSGLLVVVLWGCGDGLAEVAEGEWLPGDETTNTLLLGSNAFLMPAQNLSDENELDFYSGNSFFNQSWVEAPASTEARDGLGPLFNARSCSGCHFKDGRGAPPEDGQAPLVGLLIRLSTADGSPDPIYGGQLQDLSIPSLPPEATPEIVWTERSGRYEDGTRYTLLEPEYLLHDPAYGPLADDVQLSPRVAPHMIGLGLLEAISADRLASLSDPEDADGDGISGRIQRLDSGEIGRFGWKGDAPSVEEQVAGAFVGDMGLTSALQPWDDCTDAQGACLDALDGGRPEISDDILALVTLYSRTVAVPVRRAADDETVLRGKQLFTNMNCVGCHVPSHTTDDAALPELEGQLIWPYTDLLLHDMGAGLADGRPLGAASGREWKTPPLWGLGLIEGVNGHTRFLHDGRARSLEEAILWHGGEAAPSQEAFVRLEAPDRAAVLAFLEDL